MVAQEALIGTREMQGTDKDPRHPLPAWRFTSDAEIRNREMSKVTMLHFHMCVPITVCCGAVLVSHALAVQGEISN